MGTQDRIILRLIDSHSNLTSSNPTLLLGQQIFVTGIGGGGYYQYKIGDDVTAYNSLPFLR